MNKNLLNLFFITGWVVAGVLIVVIALSFKPLLERHSFDQKEKKYPLLSKRILNEFPNDILINFLQLRKDLNEQVAPYGTDFGIYFEYLPTGTSIGINSNNEFYAASLFKVPVIMAYYKFLERTGEENDLEEEVTVEQDDIDSQYGELWKQGPGTKVKMDEAIRLALEKSDNTAAKMIARRVGQEDFDSVYEGLDIELETASGGAILTARNYTSILKSLYYASLLEKEDSNQILEHLTRSQFNDKLPAGVPEGIKVAHKIGEYNDYKENKAFMDCGIIYVPRRPYSVCMISVGDEKVARERMKKASQTIYNYVANAK